MKETRAGGLIYRGLLLILACGFLFSACAGESPSQRRASPARPLGPRTVSPANRPFVDADGVLDATRSAVVVVESLDRRRNVVAQGSGVVVGHRTVVTAWPLVGKASSIRVRRDGARSSAAVTAVLEDHGLARLDCEAGEPVNLGRDVRPTRGVTVYAVGAARGADLIVTEGTVTEGHGRPAGSAEEIETTASLPAGLTGGGLFDAHGELIGVLAATRAGEARGRAVPVRYVKDLLALPKGTLPQVTSSPLLRLPAPDRRWIVAFMTGVARGERPLSGLGLDRVNALLDRLDPLVGAELEWVKVELGLGLLTHQRLFWEDAIESRAFGRAVHSGRRLAEEKRLISLGILTQTEVSESNKIIRAIAAHEAFEMPGARVDATEAYLAQMVTQTDQRRRLVEVQLWEARGR